MAGVEGDAFPDPLKLILVATGAGGGGRRRRLARFARARLRERRILGGDAAAHARVVEVYELVGVLADQGLAGEEEGIIAVCASVGEVGGIRALPGRDQIQAAAILVAPIAGTGAVGLPLIHVLNVVSVTWDERVRAVEEHPAAVGREVAAQSSGGSDRRRSSRYAREPGRAGRRDAGGVAGDAAEMFAGGVVAVEARCSRHCHSRSAAVVIQTAASCRRVRPARCDSPRWPQRPSRPSSARHLLRSLWLRHSAGR